MTDGPRQARRMLHAVVAGASLVAVAWGGWAAAGASTAAAAASSSSIAPVASPGCRGTEPAAGTTTLSYTSDAESGTYIQDIPPVPGQVRPAPVVFDLHGYLESASFQETGTDLDSFGQFHEFVTITPQITQSGLPRWLYGPHSADIAYLSSLLTHIEATVCVDERRVFVTGLSMGAFTTSAVACELSSRIAAVAPVAGLQAYSWCRPARAVPVVAFQGTADPFVAYKGGPGPEALKLPAPDGSGKTVGQELALHPNAKGNPQSKSIPSQAATWAARNGCHGSARQTRIASDVRLLTFPCPASVSVDLYVIKGGGHTWPGGPAGVFPTSIVGHSTNSISANQIMWTFFDAHPLRGHIGS